MPPARFEPAIPANEWPQANALDRADTSASSVYHTAGKKNRRPLFTFVCSLIVGHWMDLTMLKCRIDTNIKADPVGLFNVT